MEEDQFKRYAKLKQRYTKLTGSLDWYRYYDWVYLLNQQERMYRQTKLTTEEFKRVGEMLRSPDQGDWEVAKAIMEEKTKQDDKSLNNQ